MSNVHFNAKNYTDIQGLTALKGQMKNNSTQVAREVAQQFEALMVQMMMKSMRAANQAFSEKEGHSDAFEMYQELFDKQLSMTPSGLGIAKQIEAYLTRISPSASTEETTAKPAKPEQKTASQTKPATNKASLFDSPVDFVKNLWSFAKSAANELGLQPGVLLAQAALETNWGKQIISQAEKGSSYNLFNIKADPSWKKERAVANALEDKDGVFKMEKSSFRKYQSYAESFHDYVDFIKTNPRYEQARANTQDPRQYLQSLQQANYATDPRYSDKILDILHSKHFNELIQTAKAENPE